MHDKTPPKQSITAKRAESQRSAYGEELLKEPDSRSIIWERALLLLFDLAGLSKKQISFTPFLEIGAGSVQRSAALMNNYQAEGVATDISQWRLSDAPFIVSLLNYSKTPLLISCDAHSLPFLPNTFRFVFAYRTLHHFDNPIPVVAECYRVLGRGGHFFFNEEPLDSSFRRMLRGRRIHSSQPTQLEKLGYRLGVENIFWDDGAYERSLGMTEARFDIGLWRKALQPFNEIEIEVNRKLRIRSNLYKPHISSLVSRIVGGNVKGLCSKTDGEVVNQDFRNRLMCLDCNSNRLIQDRERLLCSECNREYPIYQGVIRMLPKELETQLYPD